MTPAKKDAPLVFFTALIGLYFAQGLPAGIMAKALPPLMREYGASLTLISMLKLLALPWFFKFMWAPFVDQRSSRRRWILSLQFSVIPLLLLLSLFPLDSLINHKLWFFLAVLFVINTLSATQDIATDGLAASTLSEKQLGLANTIQVAAYKMGLILGGSALLIFIDELGWQTSLVVMATLLLCAMMPIVLQKTLGKSNHRTQTDNPIATNSSQTTSSNIDSNTANKPISTKQTIISFFTQTNFFWWMMILLSCKLSDALGSSMLNPMLVDKGLSLSDIGYLNTVISGVGLAGAAIGGLLFLRWHSKRLLFIVCFLQSSAILLFALIASIGQISLTMVYAIASFEQLVDGISTVIIFAFMMKFCRKGLEGSDYTLQNSVHIIGMGIATLASGVIAENLGYNVLFMSAFFIGLGSLYFVWRWEMPEN